MASNHLVDAPNYMDPPSALIVDGPGASASMYNDGDPLPALTASLGLETNSIAQSNIDGVFPFERLPVELQNKIIGYAMTAKDRQIIFPCLTKAAFKPNVAATLFLVNHRIYHEAHYQLRKQNILVFNNYGSDLKTVAASIGPPKCRSGACGHGPLESTLVDVVFDLRESNLPGYFREKGCALRQLRYPISIRSLHIRLAYRSFNGSAQLSGFASTLSMIKVTERIIVSGDDRVLSMGLTELAKKLGMCMLPVPWYYQTYSEFQGYNSQLATRPGFFWHQYIPETCVGEDARS